MKKPQIPDTSRLFSLEAEAGVLGSMLIGPECVPKMLSVLPRSDAFSLPEHQAVYEALVRLHLAEVPIDAVALRTDLKEQGRLDEIGGVEYIGRLMDSVPSVANAAYYARIVRNKEKEREVYSAVEQMKMAVNAPGPVDEKIANIQRIATELEPVSSGPEFIEVGAEAANVVSSMRDSRKDAIATGFRDLDGLIHGLYPGEFVILAGRPSMGKWALMLDMALNMAKGKTGTLIFSLEMSALSLIERAVCSLACVDLTSIQHGKASKRDWQEIDHQVVKLRQSNLLISKSGHAPEHVGSLIRRLKQTHDIKIAFVDYLQLMSMDHKSESRQQEITSISRKLKSIALRENIPLVALSQLNRQVDSRQNHRPRMSDLRESGSLEQDADLVLFCYREDYYRKDKPGFKPSGVAEVIVSKNRRGRTGRVELVFVHDFAQFRNLSNCQEADLYE